MAEPFEEIVCPDTSENENRNERDFAHWPHFGARCATNPDRGRVLQEIVYPTSCERKKIQSIAIFCRTVLSRGQLHLASTTRHTDVSTRSVIQGQHHLYLNPSCLDHPAAPTSSRRSGQCSVHQMARPFQLIGRFEYRWTAGHQGMLGRMHPADFLHLKTVHQVVVFVHRDDDTCHVCRCFQTSKMKGTSSSLTIRITPVRRLHDTSLLETCGKRKHGKK